MPLLKRTPFSLLEPPKDLDPNEKVFQVELTQEIFRDYQYPFACHYCYLTYLYLIWIKAFNQIGFLIALTLAFDYISEICLCPWLLNREYLNRLDLYRQNVWTCKVSGKSKLTYKEALVCEQQAAAKAEQLPKELMAPVLRMIQHSWANLLSGLFLI